MEIFESLKTIEGITPELTAKITEVLTPEVAKYTQSVTGKTFGDIDKFWEEATGTKKNEGEFTSKYLARTFNDFKQGLEVDVSKKALSKYETEKAELLKQLEGVKDKDKIFADFKAVSEANEKLKSEYEQKIKDLESGWVKKTKGITIDSKLPTKLNEPIYKPWRDLIKNDIIEKELEIQDDGKIKPCEATKGLAMSIEEYIVAQFPDFKSVLSTQSSHTTADFRSSALSFTSAKDAGELKQMIVEEIKKETGLTYNDRGFDEKYKEYKDKYKEVFAKFK